MRIPIPIGYRTRRDVNSLSSKYKKIMIDIATEESCELAESPE